MLNCTAPRWAIIKEILVHLNLQAPPTCFISIATLYYYDYCTQWYGFYCNPWGSCWVLVHMDVHWLIVFAGASQCTLSNYWCMVMHLGHHGGITLITSVILCYTQLCSTLLYHNFMSCFTVPDCSMPCCIIPYHILSHLFVLLLLHSFDE